MMSLPVPVGAGCVDEERYLLSAQFNFYTPLSLSFLQSLLADILSFLELHFDPPLPPLLGLCPCCHGVVFMAMGQPGRSYLLWEGQANVCVV